MRLKTSSKTTKKKATKKKAAAKKTKKKAGRATPTRFELTPFEAVWAIVLRVPRGKVITYGEVSRLIERRLSPIAVGWALRAAPEGALPWHRVVSSSGAISTDKEHPDLQQGLLRAEGVRFVDGAVDLDRHLWSPNQKPNPTKAKAKTPKAPKRKTTKRATTPRGRRARR